MKLGLGAKITASEEEGTSSEKKAKATPKEGIPDLSKFEEEEQKKETQRLKYLAENGTQPLCSLTAMFPLELVPDHLIIDQHKVTILHKDLFGVSDIDSIPTIDIEEVAYTSSILSASLKIKPADKDEIIIHHLPHKEAEEAHKFLDGIVKCNKAGIDLTKVKPDHIREYLSKLGSSSQI